MRQVRALLARLAGSFGFHGGRPEAHDDDMRAELEAHVRMQTEEYIRRGVTPDEARRQALVAAGGMTSAVESMREQYRFRWLEQVIADVRYAIRGLAARPLFTGVVVTTLALGVGVNVVMFGVLDRMLLRAPPYLKDRETVHRIYLAWTRPDGRRITQRRTEYPRYADFVRWNRSFSEIAAFVNRREAVGDGEQAREMDVAAVSGNFFNFFDARPAIGRYFTALEDVPPAGEAVAVLGFDYWQTQYAGSRDVLGKSLAIGPRRYTIVGVAPRRFDGISDGARPIAFVPATAYGYGTGRGTYHSHYTWTYVGMLGRRRREVSIEAANADLTRTHRLSWLAERGVAGRPESDIPEQPTALAGPVHLDRGPMARQESRVALWVGGVAVIVLLVACANVANLLLARALRRRREMAVRRAVGGTSARLMQQVLTESLVLAGLGGAAGLFAAWIAAGWLGRLFDATGHVESVLTDGRTLVFAGAAALTAAILAGIFPALQSRGGDLAGSLKAGFREGAYRRSRSGTALLLAQTALSVVLLVGAGLFTRSLRAVRDVPLGYDPKNLLYVQTALRGTPLNATENRALMERLLAEARTIRGVVTGTRTISVPFRGGEVQSLFVQGLDSVYKLGRFELQAGSPEYFTTMRTRIVRGRGLSAEDRAGTVPVAVVSQAMGTVLWRGGDPIGKCFQIRNPTAPCTTVVGVAEDIKAQGFSSEGEFHYYLPMSQYAEQWGDSDRGTEMFLRVQGDPGALAPVLRSRLQRHMPGPAYVTVTPFQEVVEPAMRSWRLGAQMFLGLGALALALAAIGLYGVIAFGVAHRTQEIGMRIALGAGTHKVLGLVVGEGLRVTLAGVVVGTAVAVIAAKGMSGLLFNVSPHDPVVYVGVAVTLLVVSILACAVPATRAARVDPNVALRSE